MNNIYADSLERLLLDYCTPRTVRDVEHGLGVANLWSAIEDSGFSNVLLSEDADGAGLTLEEAFPLFELCGTYALPLPLAETIVARALLAGSHHRVPSGSIALCVGTLSRDTLRCEAVTYGGVAQNALIFLSDGTSILLSTAGARWERALFALDAHLEWRLDEKGIFERIKFSEVDIGAVQACLLAAQLSGLLQATFDRTLQYANERLQFGRPIGKFQAIQHQLSVMAEHVSSARMAAQLCCRGNLAQLSRTTAAVAKILASEAARDVAAIAHSIHGAIGFTEEFDLQLYTRRLYWLRQAGGAEGYWQDELGAIALSRNERAIDLIRACSDVQEVHA
jgi:acyl-CoA dehydrogenase